VLHPVKRTVAIYRSDGSLEHRDARGTWQLEPFSDLILDWEKIYRGLS
jgi:hypothetical protein